MKTISAGMISLVVFSMLIALIAGFHSDLRQIYVPDADATIFDATNDEIGGENIGERLKNVAVLQGIQTAVNGFNPENPVESVADITGNLLLISLGLYLLSLLTFSIKSNISSLVILITLSISSVASSLLILGTIPNLPNSLSVILILSLSTL